jgi:RND family efflux transporter MFP subunit
MHPRNPDHPPRRGRAILLFGAVAAVAAVGIGLRMHGDMALRDMAKDDAAPTVAILKAAKGPAMQEIVLPADVQPWHQATIYARTNGYVKEWYAHLGDHVHEGELLALIETPELDAQLRQAEADLKTAQANSALAQSTAQRWKALLKTDSVSKQETDEKMADAAAKAAALASAQASRDHLKELSDFKRVVAPFDGVITDRILDVGLLVTDGLIGTQQELYRMVQSDHLRVYVHVPQNEAGDIKPDIKAEMHFPDHPGKSYPVQFFSNAEAIDPVSQTLLVSFHVDNPTGEMLAGGYAEMHIMLPSSDTNIRLPVNTLIFRAEGLQVATVDEKGRAALKQITVGRDFGNEVEVVAGVKPGEQVIINPPDSLISGEPVHIAAPSEAKPEGEPKKDDKKS